MTFFLDHTLLLQVGWAVVPVSIMRREFNCWGKQPL